MRIDLLTAHPKLLQGPFAHSIIARAIQKRVVELHLHDLRDHGLGPHRQIDDAPYGGGAGMVLRIEPIVACIEKLQKEVDYDALIYMAPDGAPFDQPMANHLSLKRNLLFLAGHYKGIDERIRTHFITHEISIGDYVLSGGELPAAVVVDAIVRLLPGVLSNPTSALSDSFQDQQLAPPIYTRPANFRGLEVPKVLCSGNAAQITAWRHKEALKRTALRRGALLQAASSPHHPEGCRRRQGPE